MDRLTVLVACLTLFGAPTIVFAEGKQPMTVENLLSFKRVADPQVSPDGKLAAYVVTSVDLAANKTSSAIWVASTEKGEPRQLTNVPGKKDRNPHWSPDGKKILFESNRSGETQLWVIDLSGGEAQQLTTISTGAESATWSPDGKQIAFVSAVYPEFSEKPFKESDAANKKRKEEIEKNPVKAKVFTKLFYRHWDSYVEDKRQHLFVVVRGRRRSEGRDARRPRLLPDLDDVRHRREFHLQPGRQVPDLHGRPGHRRGVEHELLDLPRAGDGRHQGLGVPDE